MRRLNSQLQNPGSVHGNFSLLWLICVHVLSEKDVFSSPATTSHVSFESTGQLQGPRSVHGNLLLKEKTPHTTYQRWIIIRSFALPWLICVHVLSDGHDPHDRFRRNYDEQLPQLQRIHQNVCADEPDSDTGQCVRQIALSNKHKEQRRTKPWSALRPCPSTGSSAASQSPSVPIPVPYSRPPHLFFSLQNQIVDHFLWLIRPQQL